MIKNRQSLKENPTFQHTKREEKLTRLFIKYHQNNLFAPFEVTKSFGNILSLTALLIFIYFFSRQQKIKRKKVLARSNRKENDSTQYPKQN
jgi:hypothetical protein